MTNKTVAGTVVFFLSTLIISCFLLYFPFMESKSIYIALGLSVVTTGVELISPNGSDNLTIPMSVIVSLLLLESCVGVLHLF